MQPTRNNRGQSHENGAIESSHEYFKRRLHQALLLRGSFEFESLGDYQQFIDTVIDKLNRRCTPKFQEELPHLQPLPCHQTADYEVLSVRVTCHSTITVRCVLYTVPSQLIGQRLNIHLYQNRLLSFLGSQRVLELSRVYPDKKGDKRRAKSVDYRHVIHSPLGSREPFYSQDGERIYCQTTNTVVSGNNCKNSSNLMKPVV